MKKLFIVHYHPIEKYPPILNLLKILNGEDLISTTIVSSRSSSIKSIQEERITYKRYTRLMEEANFPILAYLHFVVKTIWTLILKRPAKVMYYETISALPIIIYKRLIHPKAELFIHFHEYVSPEEYAARNVFWRTIYQWERKLYKQAKWLSHTNSKRMELFLKDNDTMKNETHQIAPNYPLLNWGKSKHLKEKKEELKIVYIGYSVDEQSTFIVEFVDFLKSASISIKFDIYCHKKDSLPKQLGKEYESLELKLFDAVSYYDLPSILAQYEIGVILYKGINENYTHNAPNKLFEYLACDLDVWYPTVMTEPRKYESQSSPKVIGLDFKNLDKVAMEDLLITSDDSSNEQKYYAEEVYRSLINKVVS